MKGIKPRLLIIDTVSAFYWADRCVRSGGGPSVHGAAGMSTFGRTYTSLGTQRAHESLTEDISLVASRYELVVLATTATRGKQMQHGGNGREIMAPAWQQIVSNRLILDMKTDGSRVAFWEKSPMEGTFCDNETYIIHTGGIRIRDLTI